MTGFKTPISSLTITPSGAGRGRQRLAFTQRPKKMTNFGPPISRTASSNRKVTNDISREKPEEWPPCLGHRPSTATVRKTDGVRTTLSKQSNGTLSLIMRDISCNQMKQAALISTLVQAQIIVHSTGQHSTICWSDRRLMRTQYKRAELRAQSGALYHCRA